jgi:hypothetical protein
LGGSLRRHNHGTAGERYDKRGGSLGRASSNHRSLPFTSRAQPLTPQHSAEIEPAALMWIKERHALLINGLFASRGADRYRPPMDSSARNDCAPSAAAAAAAAPQDRPAAAAAFR